MISSLQSHPPTRSVIAYVDGSSRELNVADTAAWLAAALDLPLLLFRVVDREIDPGMRPDPLEWSMRRDEARQRLVSLGRSLSVKPELLEIEIVEGEAVEAIADRAAVPGSVVVIAAPGADDPFLLRDSTGKRLLEAGVGRILLVPEGRAAPDGPIGSILVPLDGSCFAEPALAEAAHIARRLDASLLLAHVVPEPSLTNFGPLDVEDLDLRLRLDQRNEDAAFHFLERVRRRFADQGLDVRNLYFKGDARSKLLQAIADEKPGLVVLSTRGHGSRHCLDMRIGSIADYLLSHLMVPTMFVQPITEKVDRPTVPAPQLRQVPPAYAA